MANYKPKKTEVNFAVCENGHPMVIFNWNPKYGWGCPVCAHKYSGDENGNFDADVHQGRVKSKLNIDAAVSELGLSL